MNLVLKEWSQFVRTALHLKIPLGRPKDTSTFPRPVIPKALQQTILLLADTARGPVSPSSTWSATSVPAVDDNVDKLRKASLAKSSHDYFC